MKPTIPIGRRDTILDLANKRTHTICTLMDNSHVNDFDEILRLVDRPVGTPEEIRNATEARHLEQISTWYDLIVRACRWLKDLNLTMTDHVPVYWYDEATDYMRWEYADELLFCIDDHETHYQGQRLFGSAIDYYALEVCEELKELLLDCDTEHASHLMEKIKQAMKDYI
jgi:hypothetical protein